MDEKIIVIGSNSFSGAHFVEYALKQGLDVVGISRSPEPDAVFLPYKNQEHITFRFFQFDLNKNLPDIIHFIKEFQPDCIVNFAAQGMVAESWLHPEHWFLTNVVSTIKLHNEIRNFSFIKKYVHISTPEVYGDCSKLISENTNYHPSTPYAVSRTATDMSLMTFYKVYNFPVVFTRAANVYGPGQQLYRIIPRTILFFLLGKKLKLNSGGLSVRSFVHIYDVVKGTFSAMKEAKPGEIFHFSTFINLSIKSLVMMIAKRMNVSFEDHVEISGDRPGQDSSYLLDSSKAREILGWNDQISLGQGITDTINWVTDNLETLKKQPFDYQHRL